MRTPLRRCRRAFVRQAPSLSALEPSSPDDVAAAARFLLHPAVRQHVSKLVYAEEWCVGLGWIVGGGEGRLGCRTGGAVCRILQQCVPDMLGGARLLKHPRDSGHVGLSQASLSYSCPCACACRARSLEESHGDSDTRGAMLEQHHKEVRLRAASCQRKHVHLHRVQPTHTH